MRYFQARKISVHMCTEQNKYFTMTICTSHGIQHRKYVMKQEAICLNSIPERIWKSVSLLKLRPDLPVLEAIFIGLRLNPDTRVSKTKESMCVNKRLKVEPFTSKGCYTGIVLTLQTSLSPYVHH